MSDGVPAEVSWLLSVMDGRAVPIGTAGSVLEVQVDEPGEIDVQSGSLIVSIPHGLSRGSRPLDAVFPRGAWHITRFRAPAEEVLFEEGDLGVLLVHEGATRPADCTWERATVNGRPAPAGTVVGDGDVALLLGTGPFAASYPRPSGLEEASPEQVAEMQAAGRDPSNPKVLLPGASVRGFETRSAVRLPWYLRGGRASVWLGRDGGGQVRCVFVDWLSDELQCRQLPQVDDLWTAAIPGASAAELLVDPDSLEQEPGDVAALLANVPDDGVRKLDEVDLMGRLHLVPRRVPWLTNPAETLDLIEPSEQLPLRAKGPVAVYSRRLPTDDFLIVLRFGNSAPTRWAYLEVPWTSSTLLVTEDVIRRGPKDETVRVAFAEVSLKGYTETIPRFPAVNFLPRDGYAQANWLVGLDDDGGVQALLVFDDRESATYTVRASTHDDAVLEQLRAVSNGDPVFAEDMEYLEARLAEEGEVTPEVRGEMYRLLDWLQHDQP